MPKTLAQSATARGEAFPSVCLDPIKEEVAMRVRHDDHADVDVDIAYSLHGDIKKPPMVLSGGQCTQLVDWNDTFVSLLMENFCVLRYDYRDTGNSTKMQHLSPGLWGSMVGLCGWGGTKGYSIADMADDLWALIDRVFGKSRGAGCKVHLVGFSMGGIVNQDAALQEPFRVISQTLISTTTNAADLPQPSNETMEALMKAQYTRPERLIPLEMHRRVFGKDTGFDEDDVMAQYERSQARSSYGDGFNRMESAIENTPERDSLWSDLARKQPDAVPPTLVIHGTADVLVSPKHSERLAAVIKGSQLVFVDHMGHAVDSQLADTLVEHIRDLTKSKEAIKRNPR